MVNFLVIGVAILAILLAWATDLFEFIFGFEFQSMFWLFLIVGWIVWRLYQQAKYEDKIDKI